MDIFERFTMKKQKNVDACVVIVAALVQRLKKYISLLMKFITENWLNSNKRDAQRFVFNMINDKL